MPAQELQVLLFLHSVSLKGLHKISSLSSLCQVSLNLPLIAPPASSRHDCLASGSHSAGSETWM